MLRGRQRPLFWMIATLAAGWLVAWVGIGVADRMEVTPATVSRFLRDNRIGTLAGADRRAALDRLARMLNRLSLEDRRTARLDPAWESWLAEMSDEEKIGLLEATLPSGVEQMLARFEDLPEEQRMRALGDAFARLRDARKESGAGPASKPPRTGLLGAPGDTNRLDALSPEMQQRAVQSGLNAFYSSSSAQTKAELAPLLEELQRGMQGGRLFRNRRRDPP